MMQTTSKALLMTAMLLFGSATVAAAGDFCFDSGLVLKGFQIPGNGTCVEFRGFYTGYATGWWLNGQACGSSDNHRITFFGTGIDFENTVVYTEAITLARATMAGTGRECIVTDSGTCGAPLLPIARIACSPDTIPVP
jgi:hypothetical protein